MVKEKLERVWKNRKLRIILVVILLSIIGYIVLRKTKFNAGLISHLLDSILRTYLLLPEWIASLLFKATTAGVYIADHQLIFDSHTSYHFDYREFIQNWPNYLLYKRISALVLFVVWVPVSSMKRKLIYSLIFIFVHVFAVVGGLFLIAVIGPSIIDEQTTFFLTPTLVGNTLLFLFLALWLFYNKEVLQNTLKRIGINFEMSMSRINEAILLLLTFIIIRDFIIPFFDFKSYVIFLLETVSAISSLFHLNGYIVGDQLQGEYGALALSKHCLGFMTMFLFAAMVYITRPKSKKKHTVFFIFLGLIVVFVINIVRLLLVFIVAQGDNGYIRASRHHEIYNVAIYIFVFLLWIIWFESQKRSYEIKNP